MTKADILTTAFVVACTLGGLAFTIARDVIAAAA